ncbi:MAG: Rrf2 family transcriptional regulator [Pyrinomonadaceae bacterium]
MATNTQFSIAVHLMLALGLNCGKEVTSAQMAMSVNTSPSFIRRILAKLSKANLVTATTGKSGFSALAKPAEEISLLEIYKAVDAPKTFAIHDYPAQEFCKVSCTIESVMQKVLDNAQNSFETTLSETSLAEIIADIRKN